MPEPTEEQEEFVYRPRRVGGGEFEYSRRSAEPELDPSLFEPADERVEAPYLDEPEIAHVDEGIFETRKIEEPLEDEPLEEEEPFEQEKLAPEPAAKPQRARRRDRPVPAVAPARRTRTRKLDPIVLVAAFFIGIAVGAAVIVGARQLRDTSEPPPAPTAPPATPAPTAPPATPAATQQPVAEEAAKSFSGTGDTTTDAFPLEGGLAVFELSHTDATDNFNVQLTPAGSDGAGTRIVGGIGTYSGSTLSEVGAGQYQLNVEADGNWTISVSQPRPTNAEAINTLNGTADVAAGPTTLSSGPRRFQITHQGVGPFKVTLYNNAGKPVGVLAEGTRKTFADKVVPVEQGIYWFDVDADGAWTIAIS